MAAGSPRMLVIIFKDTQRHIPEDSNFNIHHCDNLRFHLQYIYRTFLFMVVLSIHSSLLEMGGLSSKK
jgi:hypothetical protein